jgi:alkylated DNA repair dioxygenase AlkB
LFLRDGYLSDET